MENSRNRIQLYRTNEIKIAQARFKYPLIQFLKIHMFSSQNHNINKETVSVVIFHL